MQLLTRSNRSSRLPVAIIRMWLGCRDYYPVPQMGTWKLGDFHNEPTSGQTSCGQSSDPYPLHPLVSFPLHPGNVRTGDHDTE